MNYESLNELAVSNIRALLGARRESIASLSEATAIPESTVKRRLLYRAPLTLEEVETIARHFGVKGADLISPTLFVPKEIQLAERGEAR